MVATQGEISWVDADATFRRAMRELGVPFLEGVLEPRFWRHEAAPGRRIQLSERRISAGAGCHSTTRPSSTGSFGGLFPPACGVPT